MKITDWEDLRLFSAVARAGSLGAAALSLGTSQATLSRRLRALEARLGRALFVHGRAGYQLTAEGRALLDRTDPMDRAAQAIEDWSQKEDGPQRVRISAGTWTALDLAQNLTRFWSPQAPWVPEFVQADQALDLARREIDIGIRNSRPDHPWLAGQKTGQVSYAAYATSPDVTGWIGPARDAPTVPSSRWVQAQHSAEIITRANTPQIAATLAEAGLGRVVLPTFAGDARPNLTRVSPPIPALTTEEWLVTHQDARTLPAIRAALTALSPYLRHRAP